MALKAAAIRAAKATLPKSYQTKSSMAKSLETRLNAALYDRQSYLPKKSNVLLDILDIISRPGYAANNMIKYIMEGRGDFLEGWGKGLLGKERTEGSELFEKIGIKDKGLASIAGFVWDVFNPLDPINYLGFGLGDDVVKGSLKGAKALTKAFGKYGDEIVEVLTKAGRTIDDIADIGAPTVGRLAKKVYALAGDDVTRKTIAELMDTGMRATGNVATSKLPYTALKPITIGFGKHPFFSVPKKYYKIPLTKYLTAPIALTIQGVGKTRVGQVLKKAFSTKYIPEAVPDSVIIKSLNRLDNGEPIKDIIVGFIDDVNKVGKLNIVDGSDAYKMVQDGLNEAFSNIEQLRRQVIDNVNILFKNVSENEGKIITELIATGTVKYDNGRRVVMKGFDLDSVLSKPAQTAMDGFASMLDNIPKRYGQAGINLHELTNYVPRQPRRPLKTDEALYLQSKLGLADSGAQIDEVVSMFDPSLKGRKLGAASPREINELLVSRGGKPWLEENAARLMAMRGIRAEQGLEMQKFLKNMTDTFGLSADEFGAFYKAGMSEAGYKTYKVTVSDGGKPILTEVHTPSGAVSMIGRGEKIQILPEEMAKMFTEYADVLFGANKKNAVLQVFDAATSWYKKLAYLWNPGHIPRDFLGNVWNGYLLGVKPTHYAKAGKLLNTAHKIERLDAIRTTIKGFKDIGQEIPETIIKSSKELAGVVGKASTADELIKVIDDLITQLDGANKVVLNGVQVSPSKIYNHAKTKGVLEIGYAHAETPATLLETLKVPKRNVFTKAENAYSGLMRKGTYTVDEFTRMAGFVQQLDKGKSLDEAVKMVKKYYFDYFDLTKFEKTVMKRVIPFYTWMRKNIPLQISEILKNPRKFRPIQSAADALNQEGVETWQDKPEYIRNIAAMMLGDTGMMFSPNLPYQDLTRLGDLEDIARDFLSSVNPIFRAPLELIINQSLFTGAPIERYEAETAPLPAVTGVLRRLGVAREDIPRLEKRGIAYLFRQIPILNNIDTMLDPESARATSRMSTFLGGPSLYDYSQIESSAEYEQYKRLEELIRKLQDEGIHVPTLKEIQDASGGR